MFITQYWGLVIETSGRAMAPQKINLKKNPENENAIFLLAQWHKRLAR
jgi:hypothetical protein